MNNTASTSPGPEGKTPACAGSRESLANTGQQGPIQEISLAEHAISQLRGIMIDIDLKQFEKLQSTEELWFLIAPLLDRHPVLRQAEVRDTGGGLHVLLWFSEPVRFQMERDRQKWACVVRAVQRILPSDPNCPGLTATTRVVGSVNEKNNRGVTQLRPSHPVPAGEVEELHNQLVKTPFQTVASVLLGAAGAASCPRCQAPRLFVGPRQGNCYQCGPVSLTDLYHHLLTRSVQEVGP